MLRRLSAYLSQEFDVILGVLSAHFSRGRYRNLGAIISTSLSLGIHRNVGSVVNTSLGRD